jgi:hypothetical protein
LPKSGSIEAEIDGRRKSPTNSVANPQQQISIKQEASDAAGSPQVHLSNPMNPNLLPVSTSNDFIRSFFFFFSLFSFIFSTKLAEKNSLDFFRLSKRRKKNIF